MNKLWKNFLIGMIYALAGLWLIGFLTIAVLFYFPSLRWIQFLVIVISIGVSYAVCKP